MSLLQTPAPGHRCIVRAGDAVTFRLTFPDHPPGQSFLRTTAGNLAQRRQEIIAAVEGQEVIPHLAWHDLPMPEISPGIFEITISETEIGTYEARTCFASTEAHPKLYWPETQGNVTVKIEPAWTRQGLGVYSALPRLFTDPNTPTTEPASASDISKLDAAGYTVIPPSGTLRHLAQQLPHIIETMGFRIVLLAPIFPTPTTYARMGRFGSPFAPCDFYTVDPALAEFDQLTTPLDQLHEVIDGVHRRDGYIFLDIPINHTGWAARMMALHPEWYHRGRDGKFESPGAWGVVWEDLAELQYDDVALWQEMAAVLLHWCRQGIDGFRCDAGYMIPTPVWEYLTAKVRAEFPNTIFLLEGLGGPIAKMQELLDRGGLNWAYSELFQNYDRGAIHHYLPQALTQSMRDGLQVNFAETHDNLRLAAQGQSWSRLRTSLCALTSPQGAWGITCGVEWYAAEKIDVHSRNSLNWGTERNLVSFLKQLNNLLVTHPAFAPNTELKLITSGTSETLAFLRSSTSKESSALVLVNLDPEKHSEVRWPMSESPFPAGEITVLFDSTGATTSLAVSASGDDLVALLTAGQVIVVAGACSPQAKNTSSQLEASDTFNASRLAGCKPAPLNTTWQYPQDLRREVVWLEGTDLLIRAAHPFDVRLQQGNIVLATARAHQATDGNFMTTVARACSPQAQNTSRQFEALNSCDGSRLGGCKPPPLALELHIHEPSATKRLRSPLWCAHGLPNVALSVVPQSHHFAVLTNQRGALCQVHGHWGTVSSQYDTFFGANLDPNVPVDRRMLLGRLRIWITRKGYSTPLEGCLVKQFRFLPPGQAQWDFAVPCGDGHTIPISLTLGLAPEENQIALTISRPGGDSVGDVQVIVRPDLEDRGFHEKSYFPPATAAAWQASCDALPDGLHRRREDGTHFHLWLTDSTYTAAAEVVGVGHAVDAERGQQAGAELFSPGWFDATLPVGGTRVLTATVTDSALRPIGPIGPIDLIGEIPATTLAEAASNSLRQFIVKRDDSLTIIAGYPWFLDWGRDTLICLRGVIAAGWWKMAREVLITFARFEKAGTLPNMIRGHDDSNRDTVDAPLWFFVAVGELLTAEGNDSFLHDSVQGRTIAEILRSIAQGYLQGTPNGIRVDAATGLVYSPSHFTWMDTNHPAGTPRQGYPISAQAKWHYALKLLARVDPVESPRWTELADLVSQNVQKLYVRPGQPWLSDCLHATSGQSSLEAVADDHFRPNQLLAITLGLVTEPALQRQIVQACTELIVPGALRTLADREVSYPLLVERHGHRLNNPLQPFWPYYTGDEDTRRKPAYHNGTAWPWLMPMLAEAMAITFGDQGRTAGISLLGTAQKLFAQGALGNIAEILDATIPHTPKGCGAQAWSVSELVRVLAKLQLE